jgi:maltose O-acetyltransferase
MRLTEDLGGVVRDVVLNTLISGPLFTPWTRPRAYRLAGMPVGRGVKIHPRCYFGGRRITIGDGTKINLGCFFDNSADISIGSFCAFGPEVMVCTATHEIGDAIERAATGAPRPVAIGDGAWIGTRAVILPGVTVGPGCVVAAGAVVTRDCEPNGLYAGVPARRVRDLDPTGVAQVNSTV